MSRDGRQPSPAGRGSAPPSLLERLGVTLLLCLPALLFAASPGAQSAFELDRGPVATGELWRVVTCHWTHWTADHLLWDLAAFAILTFLATRHGFAALLRTLAVSAVAISATVSLLLPELSSYRGLSGLDSALYVLVAVPLLRRELHSGSRASAALFAVALLAFLAKVGVEVATGATVFVESAGFVPVPLAHLVGAAVGAAVALRATAISGPPAPREQALAA